MNRLLFSLYKPVEVTKQVTFKIHRVDEQIRNPKWKVDIIDRPYTVFWYVESGRKTIYINHKKYEVQEGDFVVFPSQIPFEIVETKESISMHHIEMAVELMIGPFEITKLHNFPIITKVNELTEWSNILNIWREIVVEFKSHFPSFRNESNDDMMLLSMEHTSQLLQFQSLLTNWYREIFIILKPNITELNPILDSRIGHIFHYINDHLSEKITLKRLADEVFLSPSHFSLLFRNNVNMAPMEFVRQVRIQKARNLLLTTDIPLKEIAEMIGFEDQSQLSRAFRQMVHVSPSEYRKNRDFI